MGAPRWCIRQTPRTWLFTDLNRSETKERGSSVASAAAIAGSLPGSCGYPTAGAIPRLGSWLYT